MAEPTQAIVYSRNNCPYCVQVKKYLTEQGVSFEERNVDLKDEYAEELYNKGMRSVPVTYIGETQIIGFNQTLLSQTVGALKAD